LNPEPPKYEADVLTTQTQWSVFFYIITVVLWNVC
jgi:hypothetical protein